MQTLKDFLKEQDIKTSELIIERVEEQFSSRGINLKFDLELSQKKALQCRCGGEYFISGDGINVICERCGIKTDQATKRKSIKAWNKVME